MRAIPSFHAPRRGRSVQHYAVLKHEHGRIAEAAARQRYAEPLDTKLIIRVPKPIIKDLTAARREAAARQGRILTAQPALRPHGAAPAYRPSTRLRPLYSMAPAPV